MKFLLNVSALVVLALVGAAAADTDGQLERLCRLDNGASPVTKVAEVKEFIEALNGGQVACEQKTAEAIKALEPIVELQSVCSEEAADKMVAFWKDFVRTKADGRKHLPKQLRNFFIAYGLQMSKLCKAAMIEQLEKATSANKITNEDIQLITERLNAFTGKLFDDLRVENLLAIVQAYKLDESEEITRVNMEPLAEEIFDQIRARCVKKFKPVYDSLITPIVRLAAIGINYRGDSIDEQMKEFYGNQLYKDWFTAVLACETTAMFVPVSVPKQIEDASDNNKMITFLDDEDLAELRKKGLAEEEPEIEAPADYSLEVSIGDSVIDEGDADLMRSMKNYGGFLKDTNKFRLRMMKKTPFLLKTYVDHKAVQFGLHSGKARDGLASFGETENQAKKVSPSKKFHVLLAVLTASGIIALIITAALLTHGFALMLLMFVSHSLLIALCTFIENTLKSEVASVLGSLVQRIAGKEAQSQTEASVPSEDQQ